MADIETPRLPVPLLDGERAQEHDDLTREASEILRAWIAKRAIICNHTQVLEYPEAADELMKVFGPRISELRDQYDQAFAALQRRTEEWEGEQAARVDAEQATIAADQRARQAERRRNRYRLAYESARRGRRSGRLLNRELVASYEATLRRVTAERDEAREERNTALNELALAMGPRMYADVQQILDSVLGGRREDGAGAGLVAEIQLLVDRMKAAEAEAERLEAEGVDRMADRFMEQTRIRSMDFRNGLAMDLEPAQEQVAIWVGAARGMLGDAPNYTETRMDVPTDDDPKVSMEVKLAGELDRYVFVLQRVGGLTPHEARMKAEAERDEAIAEMREEARTADELRRNRDQLHDELTAARAELEDRGKELADWQRIAGQHQAAMFDAKNRAEHLTQQIQNLWRVKTWTNEDGRKFVFVEDLLNVLQPGLAPQAGSEQVRFKQQRHAVITLIREAYRDAGTPLHGGAPWPDWGPSIDALDILRALGALADTTAQDGPR